jgi:hypothetical protein
MEGGDDNSRAMQALLALAFDQLRRRIYSLRNARKNYRSVLLRVAAPILFSSSGFGRMKKSGTAAYKIKLAFVLHPATITATAYAIIGDE